jgi:A/G-specific adenine glycosylase
MLQQTQVDRVIPFFRAFLEQFPTSQKLAGAGTASVLKVWQGLGYNRRALMLQRCAKILVAEYSGVLPGHFERLLSLPGVGPYTAGAILVFAHNEPYPLLETNIRRVYIHHFFPGSKKISDKDILPLVIRHLSFDIEPREWFSALMDYGSWLADRVENPNRRSVQYTRQSTFEGSVRQIRGRILKMVLIHKKMTVSALEKEIFDVRLRDVLRSLVREGFLIRKGETLFCS